MQTRHLMSTIFFILWYMIKDMKILKNSSIINLNKETIHILSKILKTIEDMVMGEYLKYNWCISQLNQE